MILFIDHVMLSGYIYSTKQNKLPESPMTANRPSHLLSLSFVLAAVALVAVAMSPIFEVAARVVA